MEKGDNGEEIDVSGNKKIAELDGVDSSFFEFTPNDQQKIDERIANIKNGVVKLTEDGKKALQAYNAIILGNFKTSNDQAVISTQNQIKAFETQFV